MNPNEPLSIFLIEGVWIGKTFTLMVIIIFQFSFKQNKVFDPSKQTIFKMAYIRKIAYNIGGTILHLRLLIPLHKSINDLKPLSDEKMMI